MRRAKTYSRRPRIVEYEAKDGMRITEGSECHRCENWPTTTIFLDIDTNPDIAEVCLPCIQELVAAETFRKEDEECSD